MLVEGEEEVGSKNLMRFFERHKERLQSDVIVVCDTENIEVGLPCITYSLRGIVAAHGRGAERPRCRSTAAWPAARCRTRPSRST